MFVKNKTIYLLRGRLDNYERVALCECLVRETIEIQIKPIYLNMEDG